WTTCRHSRCRWKASIRSQTFSHFTTYLPINWDTIRGITIRRAGSINAHTACLDWPRPFRDLRRHQLSDIFGHPFLWACDPQSEVHEPLAYSRRVEGIAGRPREPLNNRRWCPFRKEERRPNVGVEVLETLLVSGGKFGKCGAAFWRQQRNRLDSS